VSPASRAYSAVLAILAAQRDCRTSDEREAVARAVSFLNPGGGRSLSDLADDALSAARREGAL
jgi:hypothetical protein